MGSAPSSSSPCTTPEPPSEHQMVTNKILAEPVPQRKFARTTQVAPIIIRNCIEEYQHVTEFKDPILLGRVAPNMPEHPLIQNQYFLVADVTSPMDRLGTFTQYHTPNVRRCRGRYPVYGMGQPSKKGLTTVLTSLKEEGHKDMLIVNLRAEPVVFVAEGPDMIPYGPRHQERLHDLVRMPSMSSEDISDLEAKVRKEVIGLTNLTEKQDFYFYRVVEPRVWEPHEVRVCYDDDMLVTEEVFSHHCFTNPGIQYLRLPLPLEGVPTENHFDDFTAKFRNIPDFFRESEHRLPALIFTSHSGISRATLGMVMGCLVLAQKGGFPSGSGRSSRTKKEKGLDSSPMKALGILRLVQYFPDGWIIKQQVDSVIELCDELHNIRKEADLTSHDDRVMDNKYPEQETTKESATADYKNHLARYFYLICFNAYLREHFSSLMSVSFSSWMYQQPELYNILRNLHCDERLTLPNLLSRGERYLVADDHVGLDILSSQMDVKTSNFRRVLGMPVYGMAQPSREGLVGVASYLLDPKQRHSLVAVINLRQDLVVECNGATYSWRDPKCLEEPLVVEGCTASEIEEKESRVKREIKKKKTVQVYCELNQPSEACEIQSVLTPTDMADQVKLQGHQLQYHRVPICDDQPPSEQAFDDLKDIILKHDSKHMEGKGPAFVLHCRTGRGRTTTAMAIAGLIVCHKRGFPYGTKPGEEERVSLPNAGFTKGNYKVVEKLIRLIPNGHQVKREVDFILDQCSDTMTPMHYHIREVIFVSLNKIKKAKTEESRQWLKKISLDYLERYMYLILFNAYLHCDSRTDWERSFTQWMREVATRTGIYDVLNNLGFPELDISVGQLQYCRVRWTMKSPKYDT